jgi:KaiC/GvpD/RAD55 family RecA-like ATPase
MEEFAKRLGTQIITSSDKPMFKTANEFSLHIEQIVKDKRLSYMDAVLDYCKENYLEPADVASLINKSLKDKIEMDFRELNYLPKQAKLDV